ncbi:MAG: hypothetical protein A2Y94_07955 [Caldithrix sp. RBG_13_44_9]|nr:MAG: hypothetical protein A2Y94_07955 [Caldithrix sp. RBG_13_44_9]
MKGLYPIIFWLLPMIIVTTCTQKKEGRPPISQSDSLQTTLAPEYQQLLGLEFGPDSFPAEFIEHTGYVLGLMEENEYIIAHVSKSQNQLVWLCKLTSRDREGRPHLKILDILILPVIESNEQLLMGTCNYQSQPDPEIIAIVKFIESEAKNEVRHAWRTNRSKQRFEEVPASMISCVDESLYL